MSGRLKSLYESIQNPKDIDVEAMANDIAIKLEFYITSGDKLPIELPVENHVLRVEGVLNRVMEVLAVKHGVKCRADHMDVGKPAKLVVTGFTE